MRNVLEYTPNKTESIRHLGSFEITEFKKQILAIPNSQWDTVADFNAIYNKKKALINTQHIAFRFADKRKRPYRYYHLEMWEKWKDRLLPVLDEIVKPYGYNNGFYPRVMLAKLAPGGMISPHIDGIPPKVGGHKIHLVLKTNPECYFYILPDRYHLEENNAYEINNAAMHSVLNNGNSERIHLIFEYLNIDIQPNRDHFLSL